MATTGLDPTRWALRKRRASPFTRSATRSPHSAAAGPKSLSVLAGEPSRSMSLLPSLPNVVFSLVSDFFSLQWNNATRTECSDGPHRQWKDHVMTTLPPFDLVCLFSPCVLPQAARRAGRPQRQERSIGRCSDQWKQETKEFQMCFWLRGSG